MLPQALAKLFDPLVALIAPRYQAVVGKELRKYGLRYEDLYDPQLDLVRAWGTSPCLAQLLLCGRCCHHRGAAAAIAAAVERCQPCECGRASDWMQAGRQACGRGAAGA